MHSNELVDDVKTRILERYPTSLLLKCDPADLVLTVQTHSGIRLELQPDEKIAKIIDQYFPKGMKMNDALEVGPPVANWGVYDKGSSQSRSTSRSSIRSSRGQLAQQPTPIATTGTPIFAQTPAAQSTAQQPNPQSVLQSTQSTQSVQSVQSMQSTQSTQSGASIASNQSVQSVPSVVSIPSIKSQSQLQLTPSQLQLVQSTTQINQTQAAQPQTNVATPAQTNARTVHSQLHSQSHSQSLPLLYTQTPSITTPNLAGAAAGSPAYSPAVNTSSTSTAPFPPLHETHSHHISPTDCVETRRVSPSGLRQTLSRRDSTASNPSQPARRKQSNTSVLLLPRQFATGSHSASLDTIAVGNPPSKLTAESAESGTGDQALTPVSATSKTFSFNELVSEPSAKPSNSAFASTETLRSPLPLNETAENGSWMHKLDEKKRDLRSNSLFELQQRVSPSIQISQEGRAIIVPQIKVLIVEDNPINQRLLEAFMKRKKVRYGVAKNGREALDMWRAGGYHLIFMDIQLPVMTGLEATKEIRRLEAVNGIGVPRTQKPAEIPAEDVIVKSAGGFRSPVIIVALTASNDQDDKSDALAAGCNDFLTKPVSFSWLEKKIIEWGCMQALIDYDGWKTWNDAKTEESQETVLKALPALQVGQTT